MNTAVLTPMSPQLHARCALAVLVAALLASAMGLLAWGPVQPGAYLHGAVGAPAVAASWALAWHVPALLATWIGWRATLAAPPVWRDAWRAFWALAALAVLTAALEHVVPGVLGQVLVRVPAASACAAVALLFVAERLGRRWVSQPALGLALLSGPAAGLLCGLAQAVTGTTDLRPLLWLESLPLVLVPLGIWGLRSRGLGSFDWLVALALFCTSESMRWIQLAPVDVPGTRAMVQALHHLALAATLLWVARGLGRCAWVQALVPDGAEAGSANQRSTSQRTASR